jgi:hypothetical protein
MGSALMMGFAQPAIGEGTANEGIPAGQDCASYDRDVTEEIELLAMRGTSVQAATAPGKDLPTVEVAESHTVTLAEQAAVQFMAEPGRHMLAEGAYAGLVSFTVPSDGVWRISLTNRSWIDVVSPSGQLIESTFFAGRRECQPLRKLVEFPLKANTMYTLQLSGTTDQQLKLVLTAPTAAKP